ncbi:MAG: multidrug ABC transporter permease [Bacteroidetes bacterium]|nr:MAG: multidrug ABC transporter permease [Bacteroidota bacterium]
MKSFWGFVKKEFYHIFRDRRTLLILFGIPVVQILIFGYVVTNELKDMRIAFLDYSQDEVTHEIKEKILASGFFVDAGSLLHSEEIDQAFKKGDIRQVVLFEDNFQQKLLREGRAHVQVITDASDANTASQLVSYTSAIIQQYADGLNAHKTLPLAIHTEVRMFYNESLKGVYLFIPGTIVLILMLISAIMTSISITREKEMGTMETLLVSPLQPLQIIMGKIMPYLLLALINAATIVLLGALVFGLPLQGSILLLSFEIVLFVVLALALGILISTVAPDQIVAMFASMMGLLLPTLILSGFLFPLENMPKWLQYFSLVLPPRWFLTIIKGIMLKGAGLASLWKETLVLIGMAIGLFILSVKRFKIRLQ